MSDSFIPREDANALIWMQSFASGIASSVSTYELTAGDSALITSAVQELRRCARSRRIPADAHAHQRQRQGHRPQRRRDPLPPVRDPDNIQQRHNR